MKTVEINNNKVKENVEKLVQGVQKDVQQGEQYSLFVINAHKLWKEITEPLVNAMDEDEDHLSYDQVKQQVNQWREQLVKQVQQATTNPPIIKDFCLTMLEMNMMQLLNQSTNDDSVIESNLNHVVEQWDNFIDKKCSAKSKDTVPFVVLARYFRAEAHKLRLDRGGETFAAFAAENDLEKVIDAAPRFAYAYELLAQIYNQKGEPSKALDILTRGIDQDKLSKLDKCILLLARGFHFAYEEADSNRALVDYREAVKLDPSCANKIPKKLREKL